MFRNLVNLAAVLVFLVCLVHGIRAGEWGFCFLAWLAYLVVRSILYPQFALVRAKVTVHRF